MKRIGLFLVFLAAVLFAIHPAHAQSGHPLVIVLDAEGAIMPAMQQYIERGVKTAEREEAELLVIRLNTPGGSIDTMNQITEAIRNSEVPVAVYVSPRTAWAASAGAIITISAHAAAMAPETTIGAASPVGSSGEDLGETLKAKEMEAMRAKVRTFTAGRGEEATKLAESMIVNAKAVTAEEALQAHLIDFIAKDTDDLLQKLDGFTIHMGDGTPRTLHTANATSESLPMNFIEELLLVLTNPIIVLTLLSVGVQAILIELSSPGGWVSGFIGVVCIALGTYGLGILPVNWFGIVFLLTAFVLFILDVKAPTHGALTAAGVASFIVGALVLFNSPGTPDFARVSIPGVILLAVMLGGTFAVIVGFGVRAMRIPIRAGVEALIGKTGSVRGWDEASGQVQLGSELWTAESAEGSAKIGKGDTVEVVQVEGLRLKVKKI
jgi:membrane-bound serine protease (ClpP class)